MGSRNPKFLICINCFALKLLVVATQQRQGHAPHCDRVPLWLVGLIVMIVAQTYAIGLMLLTVRSLA